MSKARIPFCAFEHQAKRTAYEDFMRSSLIIAAGDACVLERQLLAAVDELPGFARSEAVIVTRKLERSRELWVNPRSNDHRDAHLAFFDELGVSIDPAVARAYESDHAYQRSAAADVGLVRMNFIPKRVNRSYGAGWERRHTHRSLDENGLAPALLIDLFKMIGEPLPNPKDPVGSMRKVIDRLIEGGVAQRSDLDQLNSELEHMLDRLTDWGVAYAIKTGQFSFEAA